MVWPYALASVAIVNLVSLVGILFLIVSETNLRRLLTVLVALATGAIFGNVLIHLLPEIFSGGKDPLRSSIFILSGILLFFVLEKFLHWQHRHQVADCEGCDPPVHQTKPVGPLTLIADGLHNFLDGIIIAIAYLVNLPIGLATTLAVILHELPQEIGDFAVLIHAGFSKTRALLFNLASASLAILGTLLTLLVGGQTEALTDYFLPLAAGGFLYLAGSDLVPELHKTTAPGQSLLQFLSLILGVALMALLLLWE